MKELCRFTAEVVVEEDEPEAHQEFQRITNSVQESVCSLHETPYLATLRSPEAYARTTGLGTNPRNGHAYVLRKHFKMTSTQRLHQKEFRGQYVTSSCSQLRKDNGQLVLNG